MTLEERYLGDYRVVKKLGQGPFGVSYLGSHRFTKESVVLKVLPEELAADRGFIQRFEERVADLARLDHPNLVKMQTVSFAEGIYFLVTQLVVDGHQETLSLGQYLNTHTMDEEAVHACVNQIASALDYLHQQDSAYHGGLKLSNILVGEDGSYLLSDAGLCPIIGEGAFLLRTFTAVAEALAVSLPKNGYSSPAPGNQKLSPLQMGFCEAYAFLAPEQKDPTRVLGPAVDAYALGVLVYRLLTGSYPEGRFPLPSECLSNLQHSWDEVVTELLHPNPEKRPLRLQQLFEKEALSKAMVREVAIQKEPARASAPEPVVQMGALSPVLSHSSLVRPEVDPNPAAVFNTSSAVKQYQPESPQASDLQPILTEMVVVQGGEFVRGSRDGNRDEMPCHTISLASFAIDLHPVTNEQFLRFLETMGGEKDSNYLDIIRLKESRIKRYGGDHQIESGYSKHPVVGVTWYGAVAYCKWVGKRLPTEAEWEVASRGGGNGPFVTGETIEKSQANFFSADTTPVMSYEPNGYGLYDMTGNVYEWCQDWYDYNYYEASQQEPDNPRGPMQGVYRVLRGGCWKSLKEDLTCSRRHRNNPRAVNSTYGFRCAADVM